MKQALKTVEEHREFVYKLSRLQLWWVWQWLREHPDDFDYTLDHRISLPRLSSLNTGGDTHADNPAWIRIKEKLKGYLAQADNPDRFEETAFPDVRGILDDRVAADYRKPPEREGYQCGSLKYDPPRDPDNPQRCFFHIANGCYPDSIFKDPGYLPGCLACLLDKTEAELGTTEVATWTWLNSHPAWLRLFPQSWQDRLGPEDTDVRWSHNFWGQFFTARLTFNDKYGAMMRKTGWFPFASRYAWCTVSDLRDYLAVL